VPPNFSLQPTAGRSSARRPSRLRDPKRLGVTPLADAARRRDVSCGKRRAALPVAHGASPQLSERSVSQTEERSVIEAGSLHVADAIRRCVNRRAIFRPIAEV